MNARISRLKKHPRRGLTLVFSLLLIGILLAMTAFAVDVGYIVLVRTQLQVAADSAAISATNAYMSRSFEDTLATAEQFAGYHAAGGKNVQLNSVDVELGVWDTRNRSFTPSYSTGNAIRVIARRDDTANGKASSFFGKILGIRYYALQTEAVAAFIDNFAGFRAPPDTNLPFLPFAISKETWDSLLAGEGTDNWSWDPELGQLRAEPDDIPEADVFPLSAGAPGNYGTVDIGATGNSTADLARQILEGVSSDDLEYHDGKLQLGENGTLELNGDTGISAGIKDELAAIVGQPRIVPVFSEVRGQGNNARYTIVAFAGVRLVDVDFGGGPKNRRLMIQKATVVVRGGIPASGSARMSHSIFSPVFLAR